MGNNVDKNPKPDWWIGKNSKPNKNDLIEQLQKENIALKTAIAQLKEHLKHLKSNKPGSPASVIEHLKLELENIKKELSLYKKD